MSGIPGHRGSGRAPADAGRNSPGRSRSPRSRPSAPASRSVDGDFARLLAARRLDVSEEMDFEPDSPILGPNSPGQEQNREISEVDELDAFFSALPLPLPREPAAAADEDEDEEEEEWLSSEILSERQASYFALVAAAKEAGGHLRQTLLPRFSEMHDRKFLRSKFNIYRGSVSSPAASFGQFGYRSEIVDFLAERLGVKQPTPVQMRTMPALLSGRDVVSLAPTGSGKTLAYGLPLLRRVSESEISSTGVRGLVLVPTRELAEQIGNLLAPLGRLQRPALAVLTVTGGTREAVKTEIGKMKSGRGGHGRTGCDVVVATPGRLVELCRILCGSGNGGKFPLHAVELVVLDECDRLLLDRGFSVQIGNLFRALNPHVQKALCSATGDAHALSRKFRLHRPVLVQVAEVGNFSSGRLPVQHAVELVRGEDDKFRKLLEILGDWQTHGSAIVFCDSQLQVDALYLQLFALGWHATTATAATASSSQSSSQSSRLFALHAGMGASDRSHTISEFKQRASHAVLLTTSLAARGLHCAHCVLVVNFACPDSHEDYVHRAGRAGRSTHGSSSHSSHGLGFVFTLLDEASDADRAQPLLDELKAAAAAAGAANSDSAASQPAALVDVAKKYAAALATGQTKTPRPWRLRSSRRGFAFDGEEHAGERKMTDKFPEILDQDEEVADLPSVKAVAPLQPPAIPALPPPPPPPGRPPGARPETQALAKVEPEMGAVIGKFVRGAKVAPPPAGAAVATLEINEYPGAARLRASAREVRTAIEARWDVRLAVKGEFYAKNEAVREGCRRLFVEITGKDKTAVERARQELYEAVEEVAVAVFHATHRRGRK